MTEKSEPTSDYCPSKLRLAKKIRSHPPDLSPRFVHEQSTEEKEHYRGYRESNRTCRKWGPIDKKYSFTQKENQILPKRSGIRSQLPLATSADPTPTRVAPSWPSPVKALCPCRTRSKIKKAPRPPRTAADAKVNPVNASDIPKLKRQEMARIGKLGRRPDFNLKKN